MSIRILLVLFVLSSTACSSDDPSSNKFDLFGNPKKIENDDGFALSGRLRDQQKNIPGDCEFSLFFDRRTCNPEPYPQIKEQVTALKRLNATAKEVIQKKDLFFLGNNQEDAIAARDWSALKTTELENQITEIEIRLSENKKPLRRAKALIASRVSKNKHCRFSQNHEISCTLPRAKLSFDGIATLLKYEKEVEEIQSAVNELNAIYERMSNHHIQAYYDSVELYGSATTQVYRFSNLTQDTIRLTWNKKLKKFEGVLYFPELISFRQGFDSGSWDLPELRENSAHLQRLTDFMIANRSEYEGFHMERLRLTLTASTAYDSFKHFNLHPTYPGAFLVALNILATEADWHGALRKMVRNDNPGFEKRLENEKSLVAEYNRLTRLQQLKPIPIMLDFSTADMFLTHSLPNIAKVLTNIDRAEGDLKIMLHRYATQLNLQGNEQIRFKWVNWGSQNGRTLTLAAAVTTSTAVQIERWIKSLIENTN